MLPKEQVEYPGARGGGGADPTFTVDLERQEVRRPTGNQAFAFEVDLFRKHCLLNGLDDVGLTMQKAPKIDDFEAGNGAAQPWLYRGAA